MPNTDNTEKVISRINNVYSSWRRDTSIETMRQDWDNLYSSSKIDASIEDFKVNQINCRWVRAKKITSSAIVMYIHGGGFRLGSNQSHLKLMSDIATSSGCQVLGFEYRLMPEAKFPEQLEDSLLVYQYLLSKYPSDRIIIAGDSGGGGLCASLLQKTKNKNTNLPMPAGCILLSAWLDMTLSGESYTTRENADPVHQTKMLKHLAQEYSAGKIALNDPLLSPLFGDFANLPPTLIQVGDCEIGLDDSISYATALKRAGVTVDISVWPNMIHVFQMFSGDLMSAQKAILEIAGFIKNKTKTIA